MRNTNLVIGLIFVSNITFAAAESIKIRQAFQTFNKTRNELLKSDLNKKNMKEKVMSALTELEAHFDTVVTIENQNEKDKMSSEGNQMAYDIEVLEPLKDLATGLLNKEECSQARNKHELNFPIVQNDDSQTITKIIDKICNQ